MKANYTDIICKYVTWYKGVEVRVTNEPLYNLPILEIYDPQTELKQPIYYVDQITKAFKLIGLYRATI